MPSLRERVVALLKSRPGHALCIACIARELGVTHKSAHEATLRLEARAGFRRVYDRCSVCQKTRIVSIAAPPPAPGAGTV